MGRYAAQTEVTSDRSRLEIEKTLERYGATHFGYLRGPEGATVAFRIRGRHIRMQVPLPARDEQAFTTYYRGSVPYAYSDSEQERRYEQAVRQRWRALSLVIKAKLEAAECGITTLEDEFLAHTMTPDGSTVSEWLQPQLEEAYRTGLMPATLPLALPAGR